MSSAEQSDASLEQLRSKGAPLDDVLALGRGEPLGEEPVSVHESVWHLATTAPGLTAVCSGDDWLTYTALTGWAGRIAARLSAESVGLGDRVAVLAEPSTAMVAAVLGVLRAGSAYVPVDLSQPDKRIADVLADAGVSAAVVAGAAGERLASLGLPVLRAEEFRAEGARAEVVDGAGEPLSPLAVTAAGAAYVIYTSGTTGRPKGVLVDHTQLAASTLARRRVYPDAAAFLLMSPLAFDSSVAGLWGTLTAGGRLVVATANEIVDPDRLLDLIEHQAVTRLLCVPSLYGVLLDAARRRDAQSLGSLETVIVAGESLPQALVERHFALLPRSVALVNEYGPSETTVWASYHRFDAPEPVTIGGPVPGARLYVLDEQLRPAPRGVQGELFVGGAGVSRGYLGRPEATAEAFVADPFVRTGGARMYRTGDLARWNARGTLDFLGRSDHQVKIRGQRVELGAVEAALRIAPGVGDAIVVPDTDRTQLIAFVVATTSAIDAGSLREHVADRLPRVMVPAQIHQLDRLPTLVNGKVDRGHLQQLADEVQPAAPGAVSAPAATPDPTAKVAAAWAEVLRLRDVPTDANFFDLGGHSLAMFRLQDAVESRTRVRLPMVALFRHTTVSAQAALIRNGGAEVDDTTAPGARQATVRRAQAIRERRQRMTHAAKTTPAPTRWLQCRMPVVRPRLRLVCFPHAGGSAAFFSAWGEHLTRIEVHAVSYPGRGERIEEPPATDLRVLAHEIADAVQPWASVPTALFGHSMGAVIALETARVLEARGVELSHLFASGSGDADWVAPDAEEPEDDAAMAARLVDLGGTDTEMAADTFFQELVLPYVLSDTRMFHAYRPEPAVRLHCPVTTIVGDRDDDADRRRWSELTTGPFREKVVFGDHFYLIAEPPYSLVQDSLAAGRTEQSEPHGQG